MELKIFNAAWTSIFSKISGGCSEKRLVGTQTTGNKPVVFQLSDPKRDIEAVFDEIHYTVIKHKLRLDIRIKLEIACQ